MPGDLAKPGAEEDTGSAVTTRRSKTPQLQSPPVPGQTVPPKHLSVFSYQEKELIVPPPTTALHVTGLPEGAHSPETVLVARRWDMGWGALESAEEEKAAGPWHTDPQFFNS